MNSTMKCTVHYSRAKCRPDALKTQTIATILPETICINFSSEMTSPAIDSAK